MQVEEEEVEEEEGGCGLIVYSLSICVMGVDVRTVGEEGNERIEQRLVIPLLRILFRDYDYYYCSKTLCARAGRRGRVAVRRDMLLLKEPYPDLHGICPSNTRRPVSDLGSHVALLVTRRGKQRRMEKDSGSNGGQRARGQRAEDKGQRRTKGTGHRAEAEDLGQRQCPTIPTPEIRSKGEGGGGGQVEVGLSTAHDHPPFLSFPALLQRSLP